MKNSIVVIGSLNMDLVVQAERHPKIGETITGESFHTFPGGKGANQAVACSRLGGRVSMIGRVGKDPFGETLIHGGKSDGVNMSCVQIDTTAPTGVALITVDATGRNTIVVIPGTNGNVCPEDVDKFETVIQQSSVMLLQLECPLPAVLKAAQMGKYHDVKVILNPAPALDIPRDCYNSIDFLIPNQTELAALSGSSDLSAAIDHLHDLGAKNVVVTLGEEGVLVSESKKKTRIQAHTIQPVDTTAAGDAFIGAFAVAISEGKSTFEAAAWGNAAGALAATRSGAQPSLPRLDELQQFIKEHANLGL